MRRKRSIEVLARGVCVKEGVLLVCHTKGARNTYLPGGHVEFEENAAESLRREIDEELGVFCDVGGFLGAVEHTFVQKGERHHEMNLVFEMALGELDPSEVPGAKEAHIEFRWVPLERLTGSDLEPLPLRELIPVWLAGGPAAARWGSTVISSE